MALAIGLLSTKLLLSSGFFLVQQIETNYFILKIFYKMANLSELDLINEAGSTFALYTLLRNHYTALGLLSKKPLVYTTTVADQDVTPVDGGVYLIKGVAAGNVAINLPLASENIGMVVYARLVTFADGSASMDLEDGDTIDGAANGLSLEAAGDCAELIATATGWWTIGGTIAA
jgi:hypothetical protein